MADVTLKEQKLAAARKKLRKFQKKKGDFQKPPKNLESSHLNVLTRCEISSSRSSSITDVSESGSSRHDQPENKPNSISDAPTENFQCDGLNGTETNIEGRTSKYVKVPYEPSSNHTYVLAKQESKLSSSHLHDRTADGYVEQDSHSCVMAADKTMEKSSYCDKNDAIENEGSVCSETNASMTTVLQVKNSDSNLDPMQNVPLRSTAESLRQLSLQMSGLINHSSNQDSIEPQETTKELERRNGELASLLELERQKTFGQTSMLEEMKRTVDGQKGQIEALQKMTVTENSGTEIQGLREQLKVHIQTIGILVAEKSELQTSLSHSRYSLEQKGGQVSDLQGRLDASRALVKQLEMCIEKLKSEVSDLTAFKEKEVQQLDSLRSNNAKLSKVCEEMRATTAELTERLAVRSEENQKMTSDLTNFRRQYELSQVLVEQLRSNSTEDLKTQLEQLQLAFSNSQNEVHVIEASLEEARNEKRQLEYEYKSYATQLAAGMDQMKENLASECKKREESEAKERALQAELKSRAAEPALRTSLEQAEQERARLQQQVVELGQGKTLFEEKCSSLARDNGQLSQLLMEQTDKLEALENAADRHSTQEVDTTQLLQTMQSDKIAAARALSQNKQLKEQLEELQNGFIMMSNKKLELTEKLEKELHAKRNLYQEISKLNEDLTSHKEILLSQQRENDGRKTNLTTTSSHQMLVETASEREQPCSGHVASSNHHHGAGHHHHHGDQPCSSAHAHEENDSCRDVESPTIECPEEASESINAKESSGHEPARSNPQELEEINDHSTLVCVSSSEAHEALEKKFLQCMKDLATVSDERQSLEHLVQQLQLETETIGDYITIYQFQRGVMKQQMQELKAELDLMKTEKQEIVQKLSKVQKLMENLANDKGGLKQGFLHGINSIIKSSSLPQAENNTPKDEAEVGSEENCSNEAEPAPVHSSAEAPTESAVNGSSTSKTDTVRQIMDLISEMETSTQLDLTALHRFHPCSQCSGRLITI